MWVLLCCPFSLWCIKVGIIFLEDISQGLTLEKFQGLINGKWTGKRFHVFFFFLIFFSMYFLVLEVYELSVQAYIFRFKVRIVLSNVKLENKFALLLTQSLLISSYLFLFSAYAYLYPFSLLLLPSGLLFPVLSIGNLLNTPPTPFPLSPSFPGSFY